MIHTISAQDSVAFEEALGTRNQAQPLSAAAATPRLLLVDDEPMMLHNLLALANEGYQLTSIERCQSFRATGTTAIRPGAARFAPARLQRC